MLRPVQIAVIQLDEACCQASAADDGIVDYDGRQLDGWYPLLKVVPEDFRLDPREDPLRHPAAAKRLTMPRRVIDFSDRGEQPGRKVDLRR